jgi:hypothetical protein
MHLTGEHEVWGYLSGGAINDTAPAQLAANNAGIKNNPFHTGPNNNYLFILLFFF